MCVNTLIKNLPLQTALGFCEFIGEFNHHPAHIFVCGCVYVCIYTYATVYTLIHVYIYSASRLLSFMRRYKTGNIAWMITGQLSLNQKGHDSLSQEERINKWRWSGGFDLVVGEWGILYLMASDNGVPQGHHQKEVEEKIWSCHFREWERE